MYFKDVVGQQALKEKLIQNIKNKRVSHAQLFAGSEGSGKLALAIAYARYLACKAPGPDDACGKCPSCIKYNKLAHPDLNFFFPVPSRKEGGRSIISKDYAGQWRSFLAKSPYVSLNGWYAHIEVENKQGIINAEDCNEIIKVLSYKSYESEFKVVIIWMIERLYHSAAPKLLKILEEPPDNTLFLLVSENADQILNTILSRSQWVKIPRLSDEEVKNGLIEQHHCSDAQAEQIAFMADGNFLNAIQLLENTENYDESTLFFRDWLRACYSLSVDVILRSAEDFAKLGREKQKTFLLYGQELLRQCVLMNYDAHSRVKIKGEALDFVQKFSKILRPEIIEPLVNSFSDAIYHIERNANPKILFTDLSLKTSGLIKGKK